MITVQFQNYQYREAAEKTGVGHQVAHGLYIDATGLHRETRMAVPLTDIVEAPILVARLLEKFRCIPQSLRIPM